AAVDQFLLDAGRAAVRRRGGDLTVRDDGAAGGRWFRAAEPAFDADVRVDDAGDAGSSRGLGAGAGADLPFADPGGVSAGERVFCGLAGAEESGDVDRLFGGADGGRTVLACLWRRTVFGVVPSAVAVDYLSSQPGGPRGLQGG